MNNYDDIFKSEKEKNSFTPFDKNEWAEMKQIEREFAYTIIEDTLENIKSNPETFKTYLDVLSMFEKYSTGNTLLIMGQMPKATKLMDSKAINKSEGYIKKGEKGIVLLEPGEEFTRDDGSKGVNYKTKKVFDISQTSLTGKARVKYDIRLLIKSLVQNAPCHFEITDKINGDYLARYVPENNTMYVISHLKGEDIFRSVVQELSFVHMSKDEEKRPDNAFKAYCCAYTLCKKYGMLTEAFSIKNLPENFADMDNRVVRAEIDKIRKVVNEISNDIQRTIDKLKSRDVR